MTSTTCNIGYKWTNAAMQMTFLFPLFSFSTEFQYLKNMIRPLPVHFTNLLRYVEDSIWWITPFWSLSFRETSRKALIIIRRASFSLFTSHVVRVHTLGQVKCTDQRLIFIDDDVLISIECWNKYFPNLKVQI